jgi:hypothetical protein
MGRAPPKWGRLPRKEAHTQHIRNRRVALPELEGEHLSCLYRSVLAIIGTFDIPGPCCRPRPRRRRS